MIGQAKANPIFKIGSMPAAVQFGSEIPRPLKIGPPMSRYKIAKETH
jgi:hypothetical protein